MPLHATTLASCAANRPTIGRRGARRRHRRAQLGNVGAHRPRGDRAEPRRAPPAARRAARLGGRNAPPPRRRRAAPRRRRRRAHRVSPRHPPARRARASARRRGGGTRRVRRELRLHLAHLLQILGALAVDEFDAPLVLGAQRGGALLGDASLAPHQAVDLGDAPLQRLELLLVRRALDPRLLDRRLERGDALRRAALDARDFAMPWSFLELGAQTRAPPRSVRCASRLCLSCGISDFAFLPCRASASSSDAIFFACFAIFFMSGAITRCTFALSASAFSASEPSSAEEASSLSDMAGLGTNIKKHVR